VEVFRHALTTLRDSESYSCECVVHLRPTGPVRQVSRIDEAIDLFLSRPDADSLRSVTSPAQSPYKMWCVADGLLEPLVRVEGQAEAHSLPRQALPAVFWQNGYVDIVRPRVVLDLGMMAGHRILPFIVHEPVLELDYPENIPLVEDALRRQQAGAWRDEPSGVRHPV
jgi:N-acylneuraminate cytidylyltransferase